MSKRSGGRVFHRDDRHGKRFAFSHVYTGLDYDGISAFLSLTSVNAESRDPVPDGALSRLGELCRWLYGSKKYDIRPLIRRQNPDLRILDEALKSKESIAALRAGETLEYALELGRAPALILEEALLTAKRALHRASSYVATGDGSSRELLGIARDIVKLAELVRENLERR